MPLVFVEKVKGALRLSALDRRAQALGLAPGLTLADARARIPGIHALEMDRAADARFLARLSDRCERYTPLVALDPPDGLILDITGCAHLFGGEARLRDDLLDRLGRGGIAARAGIAGTPEAARGLARFGAAAVLVPGREAGAVASLPVAALGIDAETTLVLRRAGLKTIGDLAGVPRAALAARFGADLVARLARIRGEADSRISPRRPPPDLVAERNFAEPISQIEDALGVLDGLAGQLAPLLEKRGEGGRRFEVIFFRGDGKVTRLELQTARPLRAPETLMRLFNERLEAAAEPLDPGDGFDLIRLAVLASEPFIAAQADLERGVREEEEVAALIDRLGARLGAAAVQCFVPVDTHIPERASREVAAAAFSGNGGTWPRPCPEAAPPRPIHLFDPPQAIEALAEVPDGPPLKFRWRRMLHEVARAEGPERIAPEWWHRNDDGALRDYYRIEDAAGRRFWVFREGLYGEAAPPPRWFLHGVFA